MRGNNALALFRETFVSIKKSLLLFLFFIKKIYVAETF